MTSFLIDPYRFAATAAPWTPANITTALWLDASDASTITTSSGLVDQVNDKSGNGRNFTASGGARPTYSTNTLNGLAVFTFSGSQYLTTADTAATWNFLHDATGSTVVAVWKAGVTSNPNSAYALSGNNAANSGSIGFLVNFNDSSAVALNEAIGYSISRGVGGSFAISNISSNQAHPPNTGVILAHTGDPANATAAARSLLYVNGGNAIANNTLTNPTSSNDATFALQIGAAGNNVLRLTGYIAEIVLLSSVVDTDTRQRIEGYLAHKWGLAGSLPSGHPYKSAAPTI